MSENKIKVLLVDDEIHIRLLMKTVMESMGVQVVAQGANGKEAVDLYRQHRPHICFLDINMPVMDGLTALKTILAEFPDAVIIMLTSLSAMDVVEDCINAGAANYIRKDTPIPELKQFIKDTWAECRNPPGRS